MNEYVAVKPSPMCQTWFWSPVRVNSSRSLMLLGYFVTCHQGWPVTWRSELSEQDIRLPVPFMSVWEMELLTKLPHTSSYQAITDHHTADWDSFLASQTHCSICSVWEIIDDCLCSQFPFISHYWKTRSLISACKGKKKGDDLHTCVFFLLPMYCKASVLCLV